MGCISVNPKAKENANHENMHNNLTRWWRKLISQARAIEVDWEINIIIVWEKEKQNDKKLMEVISFFKWLMYMSPLPSRPRLSWLFSKGPQQYDTFGNTGELDKNLNI